MPSTSSPESHASEDWDHVERPAPEPTLPAFYRGRTRQLSAPSVAGMSAVEPLDTSSARRRGVAPTAATIAPSEDQYGPRDDLSTGMTDDSKRKLGRQGGEAEKWAALLPKQPTRPPTAPGRIRPGLAGVVRRVREQTEAQSAGRRDSAQCGSDPPGRLLIPRAPHAAMANWQVQHRRLGRGALWQVWRGAFAISLAQLTRQYYINRTVRCYSRNRADLRVLL